MDQPTSSPQTAPASPKSTRWVLLVLLAVVIVAVLGWLIFRPKPDTTTNIQITAQGFVPAQLTVTSGTKVTWTNTDSALHQIASNPYPANNGLAGLISKGLLAGGSYSYVFEHPGTYGYHDQQNPTKLLGTIVVR